MNLIVSIIILIVVGVVLYGIYALLGKSFNGVPLTAAGIILLLLFLLAAMYLFGFGKRVGLSRYDIGSFKSIHKTAFIPFDPSRNIAILHRKSQPSI